MSDEIDAIEQARIGELVDLKSSRDQQTAVAERIARRLAHNAAVWATDCDGVIFPFTDDPEKVTATPAGIRGYKDVMRLRLTRLVAITGGALKRTLNILTNAGLRTPEKPLDAYSTYGVETSLWDGEHYVDTDHTPPEARAKLAAGIEIVRVALKKRLGIDRPFASSSDVAKSEGRIYLEPKAGMSALHTAQVPGLGAPLKEVMESEAVRTRLREAGCHAPKLNNGSWEIGVDIVIDGKRPDKGRVIDTFDGTSVDGTEIDTILYNGDDRGDLAAVEAVRRFAQAPDREGFVLAVHQRPEYFADGSVKRVGSPVELMEEADVIFRSEADLGTFLSRVVQRVYELNPNALDYTRVAAPSGLAANASG